MVDQFLDISRMRISLETNFILSYPLVIKFTSVTCTDRKTNHLIMVPVNRDHHRISNPRQVTIVQVFLYSCT
jgi:hypothetical protein